MAKDPLKLAESLERQAAMHDQFFFSQQFLEAAEMIRSLAKLPPRPTPPKPKSTKR